MQSEVEIGPRHPWSVCLATGAVVAQDELARTALSWTSCFFDVVSTSPRPLAAIPYAIGRPEVLACLPAALEVGSQRLPATRGARPQYTSGVGAVGHSPWSSSATCQCETWGHAHAIAQSKFRNNSAPEIGEQCPRPSRGGNQNAFSSLEIQ